MHPNAPSLFFERFCKRHGLKYLSLHSCRHFVASALINARLDVKTVQCYLGHSSPNVTLGIYCHEFQTAEAAAMDAIGGVVELPALGFTDRRSLGLLDKSRQRLNGDKPALPLLLPPPTQDTTRQQM